MNIAKLLTTLFISTSATMASASIVTVDFNDLTPYQEVPDGYGGAHWSTYLSVQPGNNDPLDMYVVIPEISFSTPVYFISADFMPWGGWTGSPTYQFFLHDQLVYSGPDFWTGPTDGGDFTFPKSNHLISNYELGSPNYYRLVTSDYRGPVDRIRFGAGSEGNQFDNLVYSTTAPVPEPETYAMLLAGLGLMGIAVRRKRLAA